MKKKLNNKGFSLVELIVVIAIMAVLIGLLAPQFIKYVNRSRYSTDVKNGQEIATIIQTLMSDNELTGSTAGEKFESVAGTDNAYKKAVDKKLLSEAPKSKVDATKGFFVVYDADDNKVEVYVGAAATDAEKVYPTLGTTYENALKK